MNKSEFIEKLKQNMPDGLNELEIAKYIYIQLGKEKAFDERYFFGNKKTRKKIYTLAEQTKYNTEKVAKDKRIICVSLTYLFRDILKEFGINSVTGEDGIHKYPIICLKNGRLIKADLQLDLCNIQTRSRTEHFGTRSKYEMYNVEGLSEEYSVEIDKKIGYIKSEMDYRNNTIESLKSTVKDKTSIETLDIILSDNTINNFETKLSTVERCKYYNSVLFQTAHKYINKKIFAFNCYKQKEDGDKDYTMCIYSKEKDDIAVYLFTHRLNRFAKVDLQKLNDLIDEGLFLGISGKEYGVKYLQKILKKTNKKDQDFLAPEK